MNPSSEVAARLAQLYEAFNAKDEAAFAGLILDHPDAFVIGTQRSSGNRAGWLRNFKELVASGVDVQIASDAIRAWSDGAPSPGRSIVPPSYFRVAAPADALSAVLAHRGGEWRVANAHFSVAVPDETALQLAEGWLEELGEPTGPPAEG